MSRSSKKTAHSDELPELLSAAEAAEFLNLSPITLSHYRCQGRGPIYRKHGWRIFYAKPDLIDWSNRQRWSSTGDPIR
ncbi:MAG: helix-turn-helix domain-containing protein [Henriciella sp.]|nr:helix-turn-helix domain-containing protein [Henriciella sp.]